MRRVTESPRRAPKTRRGKAPSRPPPRAKIVPRAARGADAERRRAQRHRLLRAAAVVFSSGYGRASVAAIVKSAGMSRRTFYEHFDDLTDALVQLYDACAGILFRRIEAATRTKAKPLERLAAAITVYVEELAANAALTRIIYSEIRAAGPAQALRHQKTLDRFADLLMAWTKDAYSARVLRRVPNDLVVHATVAGVEGAAMRYIYFGKERQLAQISGQFVAFALAAFR